MAGNRLMSLTKVSKPRLCPSFSFSSSDWKLWQELSSALEVNNKGLKMIVEFGEKPNVKFEFPAGNLPVINKVSFLFLGLA